MKNPFRKYAEMSYEQKTLINAAVGLCFSTLLTCGKLIIGLLFDYNLCIVAVYTFALLFAKYECVSGAKSDRPFQKQNFIVALFILISSISYIAFMASSFFTVREHKSHTIYYVALLAFIAFCEFGFSITGIFKTKNKGHYYRNIKIINFCFALIAILTTQITILDFTSTYGVDYFNAASGIGVGVIIAICAVCILIAPKIGITDREHNVFKLIDRSKNTLPIENNKTIVLTLCRSFVYGSYYYSAEIQNDILDGYIVSGKSLWKRMHIILKILCCILSEILIFVWLIGRFIFFIRSANLPRRLEIKMIQNGFARI